ncbi:unnamed protein product [Penicillium palitans]
MAAYWHSDLFQFVGSVVYPRMAVPVGAIGGSVGGQYRSHPGYPLHRGHRGHRDREETESPGEGLEQQLRGTEARVRDSEIAQETEKKRHEKAVRRLDAQLATVSRGIKESLFAKDQVIVECRQWRRKFEDLEHLQQQALENPVRLKILLDLQCEQPNFNRFPLSSSLPGLSCGNVSRGGVVWQRRKTKTSESRVWLVISRPMAGIIKGGVTPKTTMSDLDVAGSKGKRDSPEQPPAQDMSDPAVSQPSQAVMGSQSAHWFQMRLWRIDHLYT